MKSTDREREVRSDQDEEAELDREWRRAGIPGQSLQVPPPRTPWLHLTLHSSLPSMALHLAGGMDKETEHLIIMHIATVTKSIIVINNCLRCPMSGL